MGLIPTPSRHRSTHSRWRTSTAVLVAVRIEGIIGFAGHRFGSGKCLEIRRGFPSSHKSLQLDPRFTYKLDGSSEILFKPVSLRGHHLFLSSGIAEILANQGVGEEAIMAQLMN
jgi:hypothetical protein